MSEVAVLLLGFFAGLLIGVPMGIGLNEYLRLRNELEEERGG